MPALEGDVRFWSNIRLAMSPTLLSFDRVKVCLTGEEIRALVEDRLSAAEFERAMAHLGGCMDCGLRLPLNLRMNGLFGDACFVLYLRLIRPEVIDQEVATSMKGHLTVPLARRFVRGTAACHTNRSAVAHLIKGCTECAAAVQEAMQPNVNAGAYDEAFRGLKVNLAQIISRDGGLARYIQAQVKAALES